MSTQSIATLIQQINDNVTANGSGAITGNILNDVLNNMADTLKENFFKFPKDPSLSNSDIGKVVMNDGSGTAKLYQYAPSTAERTFQWKLSATETAVEHWDGPYGYNEYYFRKIYLNDVVVGDTFKIFFGEELFQAEIATTQDNATYKAAYDANMSTFRSNVINMINAYNSNSGNDFITAYTGENEDEIIIASPASLGGQLVLIGQNHFQWQSGGFTFDTYESYPTKIIIDSDANYIELNPADWRNPGSDPASAQEELQLIRDYINNNVNNLSASINVDGDLIIDEDSFDRTKIEIENWYEVSTLEITKVGRNALPPAPTALPLGKLVGIDGDDALISQRYVETYSLEAPITINQNFFNTELDLTFDDQLLGDLLNIIMIPSESANARAITFDDVILTDSERMTPMHIRHCALGIAIGATDTEVTVLHLPLFTLIFNKFFTTTIQQGGVDY